MNEPIDIGSRHSLPEDHEADPLGLSELQAVEAQRDHWPAIEAALNEQASNRTRRWRWGGGLATAASALLVVGILTMLPTDRTPESTLVADGDPTNAATEELAASPMEDPLLVELIELSQTMETQLRLLRSAAASVPAESAAYQAELEDLIVQVDRQLSYAPNSATLWNQRVNFQLDLARLYEQAMRRDMGLIASL